jgi:ABC-type branched-subunit amino acid transport system ATPase component
MSAALDIAGVAKSFGGVRALRGVDLSVSQGEILGLIGPNGSGKTTLVNVVSGLIAPDAGTFATHGQPLAGLPPHRVCRAGVLRTFQNLRIFKRRTALENVLLGQTGQVRYLGLLAPFPTPRSREERTRALQLLARFGLGGREDILAGSLSFGDQKRLELARALAAEPKVLLLDEPAGGMTPVEVEDLNQLIRKIRESGVTVLLVEHHMRLVMRVSDVVTVLDAGRVIASGSPDTVRRDPRVIAAYLGRDA